MGTAFCIYLVLSTQNLIEIPLTMKLELKASLPIEDIICSEDNVYDRTGDIDRILGHDVITVSTEDTSFLFVR